MAKEKIWVTENELRREADKYWNDIPSGIEELGKLIDTCPKGNNDGTETE